MKNHVAILIGDYTKPENSRYKIIGFTDECFTPVDFKTFYIDYIDYSKDIDTTVIIDNKTFDITDETYKQYLQKQVDFMNLKIKSIRYYW